MPRIRINAGLEQTDVGGLEGGGNHHCTSCNYGSGFSTARLLFPVLNCFWQNKCRGQKKQSDQIWVPDLLWLEKSSMGVIFCVESSTRCGPATDQPKSSQIYHSYISNHIQTQFSIKLKNYEIIPSYRSMTHPAKQNMRLCLSGFKLTPIAHCTMYSCSEATDPWWDAR